MRLATTVVATTCMAAAAAVATPAIAFAATGPARAVTAGAVAPGAPGHLTLTIAPNEQAIATWTGASGNPSYYVIQLYCKGNSKVKASTTAPASARTATLTLGKVSGKSAAQPIPVNATTTYKTGCVDYVAYAYAETPENVASKVSAPSNLLTAPAPPTDAVFTFNGKVVAVSWKSSTAATAYTPEYWHKNDSTKTKTPVGGVWVEAPTTTAVVTDTKTTCGWVYATNWIGTSAPSQLTWTDGVQPASSFATRSVGVDAQTGSCCQGYP
ncbi:hypothetical protein [Rudaeicoccus suwonensis]|uniref:Fibronectin type-III domain-containing protein n=1 Tax=Rudaeicoccus suwonensis TaxID=657409 RepID=A0A561E9M8_9MICO|nr:hypothetical protein [Rudaeicoccus suwonensis]TWE12323.1 hypothetical protein BKA23_1124 [Rudaeicoccus suwonensis]